MPPLLAISNTNLGVVLEAAPLRPLTDRHAHSSAHESQLSESVDVLAKAAGSPREAKQRWIVLQVTRCVSLFQSAPTTHGAMTMTRFPSAAPLSASLGEDSIPATAAGSAGSYRCRARAFTLDHLSERISPLVLWSELAWSELCFTERVNAHIIVYSVRVTPTQRLDGHSPNSTQICHDIHLIRSNWKSLLFFHVLGENHSPVNQNENF